MQQGSLKESERLEERFKGRQLLLVTSLTEDGEARRPNYLSRIHHSTRYLAGSGTKSPYSTAMTMLSCTAAAQNRLIASRTPLCRAVYRNRLCKK
jgi:hypothetical protein